MLRVSSARELRAMPRARRLLADDAELLTATSARLILHDLDSPLDTHQGCPIPQRWSSHRSWPPLPRPAPASRPSNEAPEHSLHTEVTPPPSPDQPQSEPLEEISRDAPPLRGLVGHEGTAVWSVVVVMRCTTLKASDEKLGKLLDYYAGLAEDRGRPGRLSRGPVDYYLDPDEPPGQWWGPGAARSGSTARSLANNCESCSMAATKRPGRSSAGSSGRSRRGGAPPRPRQPAGRPPLPARDTRTRCHDRWRNR